MAKINGAFAVALAASLGLACGGSGLNSDGLQGQGGASGQGGAIGLGGSQQAGGTMVSGGVTGVGGHVGTGGHVATGGHAGANAGGSTAGGLGGAKTGGAGGTKTGGAGGTKTGGAKTGGTVSGGTGGTVCNPRMIACPAIACLHGELPNPDPCGCPICAPPDAGVCPQVCQAISCIPGSAIVEDSCGCPTCVPADAGAPDAVVCLPMACPAIGCAHGLLPSPDPCGCPTCAPPRDAGMDTGKLACIGLDECTCAATTGCSVIAEPCHCPFPQCGSGACVCGGGRYIGCAPTELTKCDSAKARVAALCPTIKGQIFDGLCTQPGGDCTTLCLNQITACSDLACTLCGPTCDCATDRFSTCVAKCKSALTQ